MRFDFLFRKRWQRVPLGEEFHSPLPVPARTALLDTGFHAGSNMNEFSPEEIPWLRAWSPAVLVAPLRVALSLADQKRRGIFNLPSLNTAIVVLTSIDDSPLVDHHRDILWNAFGVPVFEQLRNSDGSVIARECEIHDGLHLADPGFIPKGEVVTGACACGQETARLRRRSSAHATAA